MIFIINFKQLGMNIINNEIYSLYLNEVRKNLAANLDRSPLMRSYCYASAGDQPTLFADKFVSFYDKSLIVFRVILSKNTVLSPLGNVMFVRFLASFILVSITAVFNVYAESHEPAAGSGNGIKYNYLELRFVDVDGGDGIEFGGSYRINEQFYAVAGIQDIDIGPGSLEILEIGGGYIIPNKKIDFAFEVSLIDTDFRGSSDNGFSLAAGGRSYISPEFEARVFVCQTCRRE